MTVFCPYSLDKLDTADINEIAENHHSTSARRKGKCERIENSERKSTSEFRNAKKELNEGEETDTLNFSLYLQRLAESFSRLTGLETSTSV